MSTNTGMSTCCLSGKIQEGTPTGREQTVSGLQTYVAEPKDNSRTKTIIILSDSQLDLSLHPPELVTNAPTQSSDGNSQTPVFSQTSTLRQGILSICPTSTRVTPSTLHS